MSHPTFLAVFFSGELDLAPDDKEACLFTKPSSGGPGADGGSFG